MLYGFPCEMEFSPRVSESHSSSSDPGKRLGWIWRPVVRKIHIAWKTIQNAFSRILYTLRHDNQAKYTLNVEYHEDHVRRIYLTTVLNMGESRKYGSSHLHHTT